MSRLSLSLVVLLAVWSMVAARPEYPDLQQQYPGLQQQYPDLQQQYPDLQQQYPDLQQQFPDLQQQFPDLQQQMLQDMPTDLQYGNNDGALVRERRLTCDLFSFQSKWLTPNHSACAMRCLTQFWKYKGGRCENGKCKCSRHG